MLLMLLKTAAMLLLFAVAAQALPPNVSLATVPVGYYGASWVSKTDAQIDMLSKQRVVILMQDDGACHDRCCPNTHGANCGSAPMFNVSTLPGCNPSCDQHATQNAVFARIKAAAIAAHRPVPHFMLYANSVYNWPFDKMTGRAGGVAAVSLHGADGTVHAETNDGGIYPSYFIDHSRPSGRAAFQSVFEDYIVNGLADGVYLDCFSQNPISCKPALGSALVAGQEQVCTAQRNHYIPQNNQTHTVVSAEAAQAYAEGHAEGLRSATRAVAQQAGGGGMFTAKLWNTGKSHDPYGANTALFNDAMGSKKIGNDPRNVVALFAGAARNNYTHVIWDPNRFSEVNRAADDLAPHCDALTLGAFMLALEPGYFVMCSGWHSNYSKPLGEPKGAAAATAGGEGLRREFASGTVVTWSSAGGIDIEWAAGAGTSA